MILTGKQWQTKKKRCPWTTFFLCLPLLTCKDHNVIVSLSFILVCGLSLENTMIGGIQTKIFLHGHTEWIVNTVFPWIFPTLELFPHHFSSLSWMKKTLPLNSPCIREHSDWVGRAQLRSTTHVASQHKLVEITCTISVVPRPYFQLFNVLHWKARGPGEQNHMHDVYM